MLRLTDQQLSQVQDLCRVIAPTQRGAYLELLAYNLRGVELGDGSVRSIAVRTMREFLQRMPSALHRARSSQPRSSSSLQRHGCRTVGSAKSL